MSYVDGFVAAVPTANREKYRKHAEEAARVFKEHGALQVVECWGDDVPEGKLTSFPMAVKRKEDETVVFSWVTWPSRQVRDAGMKKVMADPRVQPDVNPMPFDGKRLIYGGFEVIVEAWAAGPPDLPAIRRQLIVTGATPLRTRCRLCRYRRISDPSSRIFRTRWCGPRR